MDESNRDQPVPNAEVVAAIHGKPVEETRAWDDLSSLSSNTVVDSLEAFEDEIRFSGETFEAPVVWHVTLNYGGKDDKVVMSETFPGKAIGRVHDGEVHIDDLSADVSGFYE